MDFQSSVVVETRHHTYLDKEIVIKTIKGDGVRALCYCGGKFLFSKSYHWITFEGILVVMQRQIDSWNNGWRPEKRKRKRA